MSYVQGLTPGSKEDLITQAGDRHASTLHLIAIFAWAHLPSHLQRVSRPCAELALKMLSELDDGPELYAGLRKLREAKDCFVTQAVVDGDRRE